MTEPSSVIQNFHNIIMRFTIIREGGYIFTEEEAMLYAEACRYMQASAKALRLYQEEHNKSEEERQSKDDDNPEQPTVVR